MPRDRIIVVGGASRLAAALRDALPADTTFLAREAAPGLTGIGDYLRLRPVELAGAGAVINCTGVARGDPALLHRANVAVPLHLATVARDAGVGRFVHVSSFAVLGAAERIDAATPPRPVNPYGASKLAAETALAALATPAFAVAPVRLPMIVGLGGADKLARLVRWWLRARRFPVPRGDVARSMIGGALAARVLAEIAVGNERGVVHAADPEPFTYARAAAAITAAAGRRVAPLPVPSALLVPAFRLFPGAVWSLYASSLLAADSNRAADMGSDLYATIAAITRREASR